MSWQLIIVSRVGAFQTPQLLELSGIGDSSILKKFGIEQVLDLPSVGQNLRKRKIIIIIFGKLLSNNRTEDHPNIVVIREVKPDTQTFEILGDPVVLGEQTTL